MHFKNTTGLWQLRYKPPKGKTADCFFICGYKSEAAAVADISLLTKHLNTNKARISSFKPNFGIIITPVLDNKGLTVSNFIITLPVNTINSSNSARSAYTRNYYSTNSESCRPRYCFFAYCLAPVRMFIVFVFTGAPIKKRKRVSLDASDIQPSAPLANLERGAIWSSVVKERSRISLR